MTLPSEELNVEADLRELTAEELMRRGEELVSLGRQLLAQAAGLNAVAAGLGVRGDDQPSDNDRSVGRNGVVTIGTAIAAAEDLGQSWTRREFQEALGLNASTAMRWLHKLINNKPRPIVVQAVDGSGSKGALYDYNKQVDRPDPTHRPRHTPEVGRQSEGTPEVAYTGRVKGTSHRPGRDKKLSQKRRIRRSTGQIIGGGKKQ